MSMQIVQAKKQAQTEPIAIIGMACRYPGGANTLQDFWKLFENETDAMTEVPPDRFDIEYYYEPKGRPGKVITREGGFLSDIDRFDPSFFGISPREAMYVDPQHRLLLEVAWEALENGGQVLEKVVGSQTGVFIGIWTSNYNDRYLATSEDIHFHILLGGPRYPAAGRISYAFDFRGPSFVVDTACSSSLVAVHLACQSIWRGESQMALAGGVNVILDPMSTIGGSQADILSPDGRCKFGDVTANGYVRSEGVGIVVLKPLAQAMADNDPIYAIIRGSAVNNDGRTGGRLSAPGLQAQIDVLREAYAVAGVSPAEISFMEAHATGTAVGDPIEVEALATVLGENRPSDRPCVLGAGKTNIGHTEAAAGVAGLIKAVLCLQQRAIPANLHFHNPNPHIPWSELPFVIPQSLQAWPETNGPALAGVNSFGITGTNAHVVLQEALTTNILNGRATPPLSDRPYLLPLSAHTPEALQTLAQNYLDFVRLQPASAFSLPDFAYTLSQRRTHHAHALTLVVKDHADLVAQLEAYIQGEMHPGMATGSQHNGENRLAFVCTGMGPQWWAMGRELLLKEPVFRTAVEACDATFQPLAGWSLVDELMSSEADSRMARVDVAQPTNFALQVGLAALWQSWGIRPTAVVGHSTGEVAAAYLSGILSLADAVTVTYHRSRLQQRTAGTGKMLAVGLSLSDVQEYIFGYEKQISVAAVNGPHAVTLAGDEYHLEIIAERLEEDGAFARFLKTDVPYHSPYMDPLQKELLAVLQSITCAEPTMAAYSTVTGQPADPETFSAAYWWQNVREPVLFAQAIAEMIADGYHTFIELGPHPTLARDINDCLRIANRPGHVVSSLRRQEPEQLQMLASLGTLHTIGIPVEWSALYPMGQFMPLPPYPWQHESLWFEAERARKGPARWHPATARHTAAVHPFLQQHVQSATQPDTELWEMELDATQFAYLLEHRIGDLAVVPGATWLEMALAVARSTFGPGVYVLEDVHFAEGCILAKEGGRVVQFVLKHRQADRATFQLFSRPATAEGQAIEWNLHATGQMRLETPTPEGQWHSSPESIQAACALDMPGQALYRSLEHLVLSYGPAFQGIEHIWHQAEGTLGRLCLHESVQVGASKYQVHPALLDSAFQVLHGPVATLTQADVTAVPEDAYIPVGVDQVRFYQPANPEETWCYAHLQAPEPDSDGRLRGNLSLFDTDGQVLLEIEGLRLQKLERNETEQINNWLYDIAWQAKPLAATGTNGKGPGQWLILADDQGVAAQVQQRLAQHGDGCLMVSWNDNYQETTAFKQLLAETGGNWRGILHFWNLDTAVPPIPSLAAQEKGCLSLLHLVQAIAEQEWPAPPPLWVITQGVHPVQMNDHLPAINQSPVWGLGKVIMQEHPEMACRLVDLGWQTPTADIDALCHELHGNDGEDHIVLRAAERYVARLVRRSVETGPAATAEEAALLTPAGERAYRLEGTPGILDSLILRETERPQPEPGEVCIEVRAAGLNFMDVLSALGALPSHPNGIGPLGTECAGVVVAVGAEVTRFAPGDEVLALVYNGFVRYVCTDARNVIPKPAHLSFNEGATIPLPFLTAHYALRHMGRLSSEDRVLIHAASGGVGLAAVQIAQSVGAHIFATAGSPEKRQFLHDLGIQHVFDSRTLDFADEIMALTNSEGVDVVLNSLAGEFLQKSITVLGRHGRFLEIGKKDIYQDSQIGLLPFRRNLSFYAVDMDPIFKERRDFTQSLFQEVMDCFAQGIYQPLPMQLFPPTEIAQAFQHMARARHIGKIIVPFTDPADVPISPAQPTSTIARPDATYLITGGMGGLGLEVAQWLVAAGARHLLLVGRSGVSESARPILAELEAGGVQIVVARADISKAEDVARIIAEIEQSMPPLRGIVHAAGVLDDAMLLNLNRDRFHRVAAPKIQGAWNLHEQTLSQPLDFFILFSSAASLLGTPGQGNYVAANAFLDSLAHYRRAQGLPALSVNWGAWAQVGMAAAQVNRGERLADQGIGGIPPQQGVAALAHVFHHQQPQIGVMIFDLARWAQIHPRALAQPLLAQLVQEVSDLLTQKKDAGQSNGRAVIREQLLTAKPKEQRHLLEGFLREQVARVLRISPTRIEANTTMQSLGVDSLMALEIRGHLEAAFGVTLSGTMVWNYPTPGAMAEHIARKLGISLELEGAVQPGELVVNLVSPEVEEDLLLVLDELDSLPVDAWQS